MTSVEEHERTVRKMDRDLPLGLLPCGAAADQMMEAIDLLMQMRADAEGRPQLRHRSAV